MIAATFKDTLYYVVWGSSLFLMDRAQIIVTANSINFCAIDDYLIGWEEINFTRTDVWGLPVFPEPFENYLIKDPISANVISINRDSAEVTINKGSDDGLFYGCRLTDGKRNFNVIRLKPNSSTLIDENIFFDSESQKLFGEDCSYGPDSLAALKNRFGKEINTKTLYLPGYKKVE